MSKIQPVATGRKNTIRKERTYDVLSIQRESGKNTRKKRHHKQIEKRKRKKHIWLSGRLHFMAKWIAAEKNKAGLRHAVVCPNVTGRTKERIAQSKRARAGSLALVD